MHSLDRICSYLIIFGLIVLIPSTYLIPFLDELIFFALIGVAFIDCFCNHNWKKYRLLWVITAIMSAYAVYSFFLPYNTPHYILTDLVIELKPYVPFCVLFAIGPTFTYRERIIIRLTCWVNIIIIAICFAGGMSLIKLVMFHPAFPSIYALMCGLFYYFGSIDPHTNKVPRRRLAIAIGMMAIGILGFKAKFFGTFILALYFLLLYKPGVFRRFGLRQAAITAVLGLLVLAATWNKINYYFIMGDSGTFDPNAVQSFARPVLYITAGSILVDHFPFGSGLASFATFPSSDNYSSIYYEYGIHTVYGITPDHPVFICDSFFTSLAQYGVVGLILFIYFWVYTYRYLRIMLRTDSGYYRPQFVVGSIIIVFMLIESTTGTALTQIGGLVSMGLLGICCSYGRRITQSVSITTDNKKKIKI